MALLNGKEITFYGLKVFQIGEKILEGSPTGDGKGVRLTLTDGEQSALEQLGGMAVGYSLAGLIADAVEKKTGKRPSDLKYQYSDNTFTT